MSERDHYPAGVPCWIDTLQPDPHAATKFYGELFGWDFAGPGRMPGDPPGQYFVARVGDRDVAGIGTGGTPPNWNTDISVASADDTAERVRNAGGVVLVEPVDAPPAGRLAVCADPAGATFCVWEPRARQGAQLVNEPSAWAMSALTTPDADAARAFYGDVFGWQPEPFGTEVTLWRMPGYVGGEPEQPVPPDVVAVMVPVEGDMAPSWNVDFWVEDVDATASRAAALRAEVIAEPYDLPGFRQAVLRDPQGARFSVSRVSV